MVRGFSVTGLVSHGSLLSSLREVFLILISRSRAFSPREVDKSYLKDLLWVVSFFTSTVRALIRGEVVLSA